MIGIRFEIDKHSNHVCECDFDLKSVKTRERIRVERREGWRLFFCFF